MKRNFIFHFLPYFIFIRSSQASPQIPKDERLVVTAVVVNVSPWANMLNQQNGSITVSGSALMLFKWLSDKLNLEFVLQYPTDAELKLSGNQAAIDLIMSGKVDLGMVPAALTEDRVKQMDASTFFSWQEEYRLIVPKPGEENRLFAFIRPFTSGVWILSIITLGMVVISMSCLSLMYSKFYSNKHGYDLKMLSFTEHLSLYLLYSINIVTNHGDYLSLTKITSFALCVGCWLLGASILVYGYSSIVVSSLTVPRMKVAVNSLEDFLDWKHKDTSLLIRKDLFLGQVIMTSDTPLYKALKEKALANPESLINDDIAVQKRLLTGKYAYPFLDTYGRFFIANQYQKDGTCKFKLSDTLPLSNSYFYQLLKKGSKLKRPLSLATMGLWETGLVRHWTEAQIPRADGCLNVGSKKRVAKQTGIKLVDLSSAFFVLAVGVAVSTLTFSVELFILNTCKL